MGSAPSTGSAHVGARQGWRCREVLVAADVQPLNVRAVPRAIVQDILGNQGAQCVEREVLVLCFAWRQSCAEWMRPSAKGADMKLRDARAAQPVQLLGSGAAQVMPKEQSAVLVEYLAADSARVSRPRMWSFTFGHPEERYCSRDDRVTIRECAHFGAVRCGGWCGGSSPLVAACPCVWLVAGLWVLVMDEEVVIHTAVVK